MSGNSKQTVRDEKRFVALSSVAAAVVLTGTKLVVGFSTGSLGILSEAAHSGLDLVAAGVTYWAVRVSSRPADLDHTYGHGKFENLSALFETVLLLATCAWIVYESVERLFFADVVKIYPSVWGFVIMALSIGIDFSRSRALSRVAKKYKSQALEADALHFSTDIWSSAVVIGGLLVVFVARKLGIAWLEKADALAALTVAGIVTGVSFKLGKKSIDDLLDAVPPGMKEQVAHVAEVEGVVEILKVRIRRSGPELFADVTLSVLQDTSFQRAHDIATASEAAIRGLFPGTDVTVHTEPVEDPVNSSDGR